MKTVLLLFVTFLMITQPVMAATGSILLLEPGMTEEDQAQLRKTMRIPESAVQTEIIESRQIRAFYLEKRSSGRLNLQVVGYNTLETAKIKRLLERAGTKNVLIRIEPGEGFTDIDALDGAVQAMESIGAPLDEELILLAREENLMRSFSTETDSVFENLEERVQKRAQELKRELLPEEIKEIYDDIVSGRDFLFPEDLRDRLTDWMERAQDSLNIKNKADHWLNKIKEGKWVQDIRNFFGNILENLLHRIRGHHGLERT